MVEAKPIAVEAIWLKVVSSGYWLAILVILLAVEPALETAWLVDAALPALLKRC